MNILVVCSRSPYPVESGGSRRIDSIIQNHIDNGHKVTLIYVGNSIEQECIPNGLNLINIKILKITFILNILRNLWRLEPLQVSMYRFKKLQEISSSCTYDVLICHMVRVSWIEANKSSVRKILEMTDSLSLNYSRLFREGNGLIVKNPLKYIIYKVEAILLSNYEKKLIDKFDKTVLVSTIDRDHILADKNMNRKVEIIPLCVEGNRELISIGLKNSNIIFIGKLNYPPNNDALLHFIDNVYRRVIEKNSEISLKIIGKNPSKELKKRVDKYTSISLCGYVENLYHEVNKAFCSVAPMITGAGMQTKILDSMEYGLPVITTKIGFGDFDFRIGEEIFIASSSQEYVDKILELYQNKKLANRVGMRAREAVLATYGREIISAKYEKII
jgi:glycosyltransferase involved in cell wall biosynthesis